MKPFGDDNIFPVMTLGDWIRILFWSFGGVFLILAGLLICGLTSSEPVKEYEVRIVTPVKLHSPPETTKKEGSSIPEKVLTSPGRPGSRELVPRAPVSDSGDIFWPDFPGGYGDYSKELAFSTGNPVGTVGSAEAIPPRLIYCPDPVYPARAQRDGIEGSVQLQFRVGIDGEVNEVKVLASQPSDLFVSSAIEAVRHWHFLPASHNGAPVPAQVSVPVLFCLKQEGVD